MVGRGAEFVFMLIAGIILPAKLFVLLTIFIVIIDTLVAISSLKKRKKKFSMKKLLGSFLLKIGIYQIVILGGYWFDAILISEFTEKIFGMSNVAIKLLTMIILTKEVISINKHFKVIFGRSLKENATDAYDMAKDAKDKINDILKKDV